ncbi:MAG: hypothetical protein ABIB72_02150 [Candidatus Falkowbacteria bacterium]
MTTKIDYETTEWFEKDLKRLKRFSTLLDDLETAKKNAIELYHLRKINNLSCFPIPGFCYDEVQICKIKKFACRSLKGKGIQSGIRVIYAYFPKSNKVVFIEIYYKGNKNNEDKERIKLFLKK